METGFCKWRDYNDTKDAELDGVIKDWRVRWEVGGLLFENY